MVQTPYNRLFRTGAESVWRLLDPVSMTTREERLAIGRRCAHAGRVDTMAAAVGR